MSTITVPKLASGYTPCMSYIDNTTASAPKFICDIPRNNCEPTPSLGLNGNFPLPLQINKYLSPLPVSPKVSSPSVNPTQFDFLTDSLLEFFKLTPDEMISKAMNWLYDIFRSTPENENQMRVNTSPAGPIRMHEKSLYGVYYGSWDNALIQEVTGKTGKRKYDLVIVNPLNITPTQVAELKASYTLVLSYLSIGEDRPLHPDAPWYYDADHDAHPDKNKAWDSYYVNVSNPQWHQALRNGNKDWKGYEYSINTLGCDGLFLDTLDTVSPAIWGGKYAGELGAMINLIAEIRFNFPHKYLIANRGLFYLNPFDPTSNPNGLKEITPTMREQFIASINGNMFENYSQETPNERRLWSNILNNNHDKLTLLSLDYPPTDINIVCETKNKNKWLSHFSQRSLATFVHEVRDRCPD